MKNNKGSILVLVIMIFLVLTILGTSILGFALAENKHAIYYQNKTQSYYIAKSGADVVEAALVEQLKQYGDDVQKQKEFLDVFDEPKTIEVDLDGIKNITVMNEIQGTKRALTIKSTAEYQNIEQSVKKVLYSTVTEITSNNNGITISDAPLMYTVSAKQYHNKGVSDMPEEYATKVSADVFKKHIFPAVANWGASGDKVISGGTFELSNGETDYYVNGSLTLKGTIYFKGKINIYVKEDLILEDGLKVISESIVKDDIKEYWLNIYVYNQNYNESNNNNVDAIKVNDKIYIDFTGNLYIKQGNVNLNLHQNSCIKGNIIFNGKEFHIGTQHNNNKPVLEGSIYAPDSDIYIGDQKDKASFILKGLIIGKNLSLHVKNDNKANEFYTNALKNSRTVHIPVDTGTTITTRTIMYNSYYSD